MDDQPAAQSVAFDSNMPGGEGAGTAADASTDSPTIGGAIEAVLLFADRAVGADKLARAVGLVDDEVQASDDGGESRRSTRLAREILTELQTHIDSLNDAYASTGRAFRIERVAGGYRLMTLPMYARAIIAYQNKTMQNRLSKPAIETLAIIAYRQPITRAQIEAIRGVGAGEVLKKLMDHRLITIAGRAEELGRPILYGTTRHFLETFGLASLDDLPNKDAFAAPAASLPTTPKAAPATESSTGKESDDAQQD